MTQRDPWTIRALFSGIAELARLGRSALHGRPKDATRVFQPWPEYPSLADRIRAAEEADTGVFLDSSLTEGEPDRTGSIDLSKAVWATSFLLPLQSVDWDRYGPHLAIADPDA